MNYSLPFFRLSAVLTFVFNAFIMKAEAPDTVLLPHVIQYCISHEDLINNRWSELQVDEPAFVKDANGEKKATTELYFLLQKKSVRKEIGKKALAVKCDSTFMLNLRSLRIGLVGAMGRDFARAYPLKDGRYVITYYDVSKMGGASSMGVMGGLMGATIMLAATENIRSNYVCYLFTPGVNKVVRIKNDVLKELLVGHDDLFDEYSKIDRYERNFEGIILPLLKRANLFR